MLPDPWIDREYADPAYTDPAYIEADDRGRGCRARRARAHLDEIDEPPSYLHAVREPLFGGRFEDGLRRDEPYRDEPYRDEVRRDEVRRHPRRPAAGGPGDEDGPRRGMNHRTACSRSAAVR